jgi:endo-1,4-beta-xylanase
VTDGTWTNETLTAVMKNHIQTLITHWQDACYSWDVVNEALASNGSFSSSIWVSPSPSFFSPLYMSTISDSHRMSTVRRDRP